MNNNDYEEISREEYYFYLAQEISSISPDPNTKVCAIYVKDNEILSIGYNRYPLRWTAPETMIWKRKAEKKSETKYPYVIHAEQAGIQKDINYMGATCYVTLFPCSNCAKAIVESGVTKVVYLSLGKEITDERKDEIDGVIKLFRECGVECLSYEEEKLRNNGQNDTVQIPQRRETPKILCRSLATGHKYHLYDIDDKVA